MSELKVKLKIDTQKFQRLNAKTLAGCFSALGPAFKGITESLHSAFTFNRQVKTSEKVIESCTLVCFKMCSYYAGITADDVIRASEKISNSNIIKFCNEAPFDLKEIQALHDKMIALQHSEIQELKLINIQEEVESRIEIFLRVIAQTINIKIRKHLWIRLEGYG